MNIRKISFYLLGGLLVVLPLVFLLLPSKSGAADGNDRNGKSQSSKTDRPSNYDALTSSPKRTDKNGQASEHDASEQKVEGGRLVQVEPRFDVPTFLWAAEPAGAKSGQTGKVSARGKDAAAAGRAYLGQYALRYRLKKSDVAEAKVASVHDTGKGAIIVKFKQAVGGVEVFRDEINVIMNRDLQLIALSGYLTGDNTGDSFAPQDFQLQPEDALAKAVEDLTGRSFDASVLQRIEKTGQKSGDNIAAESFYTHFNADNAQLQNFAFGEEPSRTKKVMFHLPGGYVPAYYVEARIYVPSTDPSVISETPLFTELGYAYVVSAVDGRVLFRHNQVSHSTDFSYRVWADSTTKLPADSPAGNSVHPKLDPVPDGVQYPSCSAKRCHVVELPV